MENLLLLGVPILKHITVYHAENALKEYVQYARSHKCVQNGKLLKTEL